ncbi:hypothetical protein ACFFMN_23225 [Planobispora siamensis]|uniref:Uncharacterized protein n=1 Tax=Planobispora siamensis TaxID=936338 RepID=A0A8J3SMY3_9ACTN|nr:hypothetical protein [Planobispora siamensis]GIH95274.1 hypothetical protein Psi01_59040 [Planobispora siamensis]
MKIRISQRVAIAVPPPPPLVAFIVMTVAGVYALASPWPTATIAAVIAGSLAWSKWIAHRLPGARTSARKLTQLTHLEPQEPDPSWWQAACQKIQARHPGAEVVLRLTCTADGHDALCRGPAAVGVAGERFTVMMCRHAIPDPNIMIYAMGHEVAHVTGGRWTALWAAGIAAPVVGPLIGFIVAPATDSLTVALTTAYLLYVATFWAIEIACDLTAQQQLGRPAAVRYWATEIRSGRARPLKAKMIRILTHVVVGSHPPDWMRLAAAWVAPAR